MATTTRKNYYYYSPRGFANEYSIYFVYERDEEDVETLKELEQMIYKYAVRKNQECNYRFYRINAAEAHKLAVNKDNYSEDGITHINDLYNCLYDDLYDNIGE